jgi:hypothetical protein
MRKRKTVTGDRAKEKSAGLRVHGCMGQQTADSQYFRVSRTDDLVQVVGAVEVGEKPPLGVEAADLVRADLAGLELPEQKGNF